MSSPPTCSTGFKTSLQALSSPSPSSATSTSSSDLSTKLSPEFATPRPRFLPPTRLPSSVVVSSPSAAEECLAKNDIVFANRPSLMTGRIMAYNYTSLAWASYGDHGRNLRRIASLELLSAHRLQTLAAIRRDEVKSLIHRLIKINHIPVQNDGDDRIVNLIEGFVELTPNSMMRMIAGERYYGETAARFREIQTEIMRVGGKSNLGDYLPFIRWIGGQKRLENDIKRCREREMS